MSKPPLSRISLKRAYEAVGPDDGVRILVERLWPRGVSREQAAIDHWFKDLAPSTELRRWYAHEPERWPEFRRRYLEELGRANPETIDQLTGLCRDRTVTLVFASREETQNSATVLRGHVLEIIRQSQTGR